MNIGIIALGVVGSAVKHGLERIGHNVRAYDIKLPDTSLADVLETEICFLCVPTPPRDDGSCDISIVERTVGELNEADYQVVVVIKSTVIPGTTNRLAARYPKLNLAFCPEFLRERSAYTDFVEKHDVCVIGAYDVQHFELIKQAHGALPKHIFHLTPLDAEFAKYFSNVFNALRIIFANEFYDVCKASGANYAPIKQALVHRDTIEDVYLDCNENFRGFAGVCLPKDTAAFAAYVKQLGLDLKLFETIVEENKRFRPSVPKGMRP